MMTKKLLPVVFILLAQQVLANDLESLLDEGTQKGTDKKSNTKFQFNPLVPAIQSELNNQVHSEQQVFFRYLESQDFKKALIQYSPAFSGTSYARSESGVALLTYLKIKTGLSVMGLEELMSIQNPSKIHPELAREIRQSLPLSHLAWSVARFSWNKEWTSFFGHEYEMKVRVLSSSYKSDLKTLKDLSEQAPVNSSHKALADWNLALAYSMNNQSDLAAKLLAQVLKNTQSPIKEELVHLTAGRLLFQNGYFQAAIKYFEKVPKKSDYWFEAQEEMAWSAIRLAEPQNALAISETLTHAAFKNSVGPETYFVKSLAELKVCAYPQVVKTLKSFAPHFKERTTMLKALVTQPKSTAVDQVLAKMQEARLSWSEVGKNSVSVPRTMNRDEKLYTFALNEKVLKQESKMAETLYADSLALTGLQAQFERMKNQSLDKAQKAESATYNRVKELAQYEVDEISKILNKLHIVEAEVIQQVDLASKIIKTQSQDQAKLQMGTTGAKTADVLVFPASQEVWFDELSNYKFDVKKACQATKKE